MDQPETTQFHAPDIRLVALDLDGTLLTGDKQLPAATQRVIARCVECGVKVVLASARPPRSVRPVYNLLNLDTLSVHYNGALISDLRTNRYWCHMPLPADLVRDVIATARRIDPHCLISVEILDKWYTDRFDEEKAGENGRLNPPAMVGPFDAFVTAPVTKLMLLDEPKRLRPVREAINALYAGQMAMAVSDDYLIQLMHPQADKSTALMKVAEQYGVSSEQVMAVGDAPNDCGMLRWAGLGVAVANAWVEVLDSADVVVPPNDVGGVAYAIQRYVLDVKDQTPA
ncbi:HAD family hydrolase [Planctomycetales bacterium ZRK34]|nr:HAD family hydrolase [Planctomycetales bacterium ZRK34]